MKSRLNICMVSDDARPAATGVGIHVQHVSKELVRRGHRVSILTTRRHGEPEVETWDARTPAPSLYPEGVWLLSGIAVLCDRASHSRGGTAPTWCTTTSGASDETRLPAAEALNLPQVSTYHFTAEVLTQPIRCGRFGASSADRSSTTAIVSTWSSHRRRKLATQISRDGIRTPVRYISNPVVFGETGDIVPAVRESGFTVLYAGRLGPEKNLPYLLDGL